MKIILRHIVDYILNFTLNSLELFPALMFLLLVPYRLLMKRLSAGRRLWTRPLRMDRLCLNKLLVLYHPVSMFIGVLLNSSFDCDYI